MNAENRKILCVEDDKDTCELLTYIFAQIGYEVRTCSQDDCLKTLRQESFQAIILNNFYMGQTGAQMTREIKDFDSSMPVIFLSGESRLAEIDKVMQAGANAYFVKPGGLERLLDAVVEMIEN